MALPVALILSEAACWICHDAGWARRMIPFKHVPLSIPLAERTPTVRSLLSIIEQQQTLIGQLQSQVEQLRLLNEQQQETLLEQKYVQLLVT